MEHLSSTLAIMAIWSPGYGSLYFPVWNNENDPLSRAHTSIRHSAYSLSRDNGTVRVIG